MPKPRPTPALPSLLAPHILSPFQSAASQRNSLTLITHTLSASPLWLLLKYLVVGLLGPGEGEVATSQHGASEIVLASFVREWKTWREGTRRMGIDLSVSRAKTLAYVDLLANPIFSYSEPLQALENLILSAIGTTKHDIDRHDPLGVDELLGQHGRPKPILILDGLDFWLAAMAGVDGVSVDGLVNCVSELREHASALVISVSADSPLVFPTSISSTPLDKSHFTLIASLAHQADQVLQLRGLETGVARDVSGVVRVCGGRGWRKGENEYSEEKQGSDSERDNWEGLYFLGGDGSVKVWERGKTTGI